MPDRPVQEQTLWRAFVPKWGHLPLSGQGAARFGGRWNPIGTPTIYAARELSTAWSEYNQGFVQHPALIAQLSLLGAHLTDLTDAAVLAGLGKTAEIHQCQWRSAMDAGLLPETHEVQARLQSQGSHGVIYPSVMSPGGTCVALWRWNVEGAPRVEIVDPEGRMPKSQASWF